MILAFNVFSGSERDAGVRTPINTVLELADQGKLKSPCALYIGLRLGLCGNVCGCGCGKGAGPL
jgi:hypothetical protein